MRRLTDKAITITGPPASRLTLGMLLALICGNPLAELPAIQPPIAEAPVAEPPIAEPPIAEPPIAEPPVAEAPVDAPGDEAPQTVAGRELTEWTAEATSDDRVVRLRAVRTLGLFGTSAGDALSAALVSSDPAVRYVAAVHLGRIGGQPLRAAVERLQTLRDEPRHPAVQIAAAFALCQTGKQAGNLDLLTGRLGDPERGMACSAAELLGLMGPAARTAVPALQQAIADHGPGSNGDHQIGGAASNALRKIQSAAVEDDR